MTLPSVGIRGEFLALRAEVSGRIDRLTGQSGFRWLGLARIGSVVTLVASRAGVRTLPERVSVRRPKI